MNIQPLNKSMYITVFFYLLHLQDQGIFLITIGEIDNVTNLEGFSDFLQGHPSYSR